MSTIITVLILKIRKLKFRSYFAKIMSIGNNTAEPESWYRSDTDSLPQKYNFNDSHVSQNQLVN